MESPQNVEVFIEDKDGNVVASIRNVKNTFVFDGEEYTFPTLKLKDLTKKDLALFHSI